MSVLIIGLELWMILRLLSRQLSGIDIRSDDYYISHYFNYFLLLGIGTCMLIYIITVCFGIYVICQCPEQLGELLTFVGAPTAVAIGFYAWKAKCENIF